MQAAGLLKQQEKRLEDLLDHLRHAPSEDDVHALKPLKLHGPGKRKAPVVLLALACEGKLP
jgi:hypothetical protein